MRRHSFVARLGPSDNMAIPVIQADSLRTEIRFIDGYRRLGYGLGQMIDELTGRGVTPSETAADLAILSAMVTAADTRISRAIDAQDSWTREIDLYVPVREPDRWHAATPLIERTLKFLTGDHWRLSFRERPRGYAEVVRARRARLQPDLTSVCLFSGGLDSFIGAIDLLATGQHPLLVSHYWENSTSSQESCARSIAAVYGDIAPRHVRARVGFDQNDFAREMDTESSTRGRSFLFFALAALAASGMPGRTTVYVPENGLILARWQDLLDALGIDAALENPYRFATKGEMLANCHNAALAQRHLAETISCSSIAKARWKGLAPGHCGFCVPCLIRRAAIRAAFENDPTRYTLAELTARRLDAASAEGEHIRAFQMMARRLRREAALPRILVHKPGPLSDYPAANIVQYADVFRRGIQEVDRLTAPVVVGT